MGDEWKLARIRSTCLGIEDHGFLTFYLQLDYAEPGEKIGGESQGFGGYGMWTEKHGGTKGCGEMIARVLLAAGTEDWEHLPGRLVWAQAEYTKVHRIMGVDTGLVCDLGEIAERTKEG